jgi:hypothetical protein
MVDNSSTMPQTVGEENGEKRRECALSHAIPNEERKRGGRNKDYFAKSIGVTKASVVLSYLM